MLEKWKRALDKGEYFSALFMDLSKAFDTINHDLLIVKPKAYGFSKETLKLMKIYLRNKKQKVQIKHKFNKERDVIAGVPQGSIDDRPFVTLFTNDLVVVYNRATWCSTPRQF